MQADRILGAVVILGALAFIASASTIPHNRFLAGPVGSGVFPMIIGGTAALCGLAMVLRPDADPEWPDLRTLGSLGIAVAVMVAYAYALKPMGFLIPTALAAGVLSYQISPRLRFAVLAGVGLSIGLFVIFRFALGLSLFPLPRGLLG